MNQTLTIDFDSARQEVEDAGLFVSLCTIKRAPGTQDALGQPDLDPADFTNVFVDVACMVSPNIKQRPVTTSEKLTYKYAMEETDLHVLLDGHFPTILDKDIAVLDGVVTNIKVVENDSQGTTTRLGCIKVAL